MPAVPVLPQLADPGPSGDPTTAMPPVPPFSIPDPGAGIYLHWAAPDGVTSTQTLSPTPAAVGDDIGAAMPPLADRWLVVRLGGGTPRRARGWVIEAERGRRVDLASWTPTDQPPDDGTSRTPHFPSNRLTAVAGGDPAWAAVYDAVEDRFAMHDDLSDLDPADANGPLSYLVCGGGGPQRPSLRGRSTPFVEKMGALRWSTPAVTAARRPLGTTRRRLAATGISETRSPGPRSSTRPDDARRPRAFLNPDLADCRRRSSARLPTIRNSRCCTAA